MSKRWENIWRHWHISLLTTNQLHLKRSIRVGTQIASTQKPLFSRKFEYSWPLAWPLFLDLQFSHSLLKVIVIGQGKEYCIIGMGENVQWNKFCF